MNSMSRRAANWMIGLGLLDALIAVALGVGAGAAVFDSAKRGGDWQGVGYIVGALAGGAAVVVLAVAVTLLIAQTFVRQGSRRAMLLGIVVIALMLLVPVLPVWLSLAGNFPGPWPLAGLALGVILLSLPARGIWLLWRARRDQAGATKEISA
jgi:hypothetical protein